MSTRDAHTFYSLLQAYDLLGERVFKEQWTGHEAFSRPTENPNAFEIRKQEIEIELSKLRKADRRFHAELDDDLTEEEYREISEASKNIWEKRDILRRELNEMPPVGDIWHEDFEAFQRRTKTERILRDAFETGALTLQLLGGPAAKFNEWISERHFYVSFTQSVVIPPASAGLRSRRCPAYVERDKFLIWLENKFPVSEGRIDTETEERCRIWLLQLAQAGSKPGKKDAIWGDAKAKFPSLSRRAFDRVWGITVPPSWSKAGPS